MNDSDLTKNCFALIPYLCIYEKCYDGYDNIIKTYPTFMNDIEKLETTKIFKEMHPNATEKDIIAHGMTMIVFTYFLCEL